MFHLRYNHILPCCLFWHEHHHAVLNCSCDMSQPIALLCFLRLGFLQGHRKCFLAELGKDATSDFQPMSKSREAAFFLRTIAGTQFDISLLYLTHDKFAFTFVRVSWTILVSQLESVRLLSFAPTTPQILASTRVA